MIIVNDYRLYTIIKKGKGSRVGSVYFMDNGCRRRENIIKKTDRNFVREGGIRKEHRNKRVWVLA